MSRTLSTYAKTQIFGQISDDPLITLLEFNHPDLPTPVRICDYPAQRLNDGPLTYGTISGGHTYTYVPFTEQLPDEQEDRAPVARILIDNVSLALVDQLRSVTTPGTCDISLVFASDPDTVEVQYPILDLRSAQLNKDVVTVEMGIDSLETEPLPGDEFLPSWFPALFSK